MLEQTSVTTRHFLSSISVKFFHHWPSYPIHSEITKVGIARSYLNTLVSISHHSN